MSDARAWIERLGLRPHPEGGWYRETHRSTLMLPAAVLPRHPGPRVASTAILYLLGPGEFSSLHRIRSEELWHHHAGATVEIHSFDDDGHRIQLLRGRPEEGARPQVVVPAGVWFGARVRADEDGDWALCGCTVAPGFEFEDFELAERDTLLALHPEHAELIRALTPPSR